MVFISSFFVKFSPALMNNVKPYVNLPRNFTKLVNFTVYRSLSSFSRETLIFPSFITKRGMAGHAKWQNIKYIKAEKDRQKNFLCNKYVRLVTAAIKEKGPDPKSNNKLATILEDAKKNNVPAATLENAMKRSKNKKLKPGTIEILGPGGVFIILDYETDNVCDLRHSLKIICKKYSASILSGEGRWRASYEQKGIIRVTGLLIGGNIDAETVLDAAIEAGAEDVQKRDEDDTVFYEFFSAPDDLHIVKKELEKTYEIEEFYVGYLPISTVTLSDNDLSLAHKFLIELGDLPDVCRLYENIE